MMISKRDNANAPTLERSPRIVYPANNLFLKQKSLGRSYMPESKRSEVKGSKRSEQVAWAKPPTHACQSSVKAAGLDGGLDEPASKH